MTPSDLLEIKSQPHDVIQVNEHGLEAWIGCLLLVDEIKSFGVVAFLKVPKSGNAYVRLPWEHFDRIGPAVLHPTVGEAKK